MRRWIMIRGGKALYFADDNKNCYTRYEFACFDDIGMPVDPSFTFNGRAWVDPFDKSMIMLDDPATVAWPRCVRTGAETPESREWRSGFERGRYGLRALAFRETAKRPAEWMDGYTSGRSARVAAMEVK